LEFRICDVQMTVDETIALAALIQAVVVKLHKLIQQNLGFRIYERALMMENKWRAARYGISGKLIDFGKQAEVPFTELAKELLEFIDDVVDELGSREEINHIFKMMENGTGADRQLKVFHESGNDFKTLVDYIVDETNKGLDYKPKNIKTEAETKYQIESDIKKSILTKPTTKKTKKTTTNSKKK